MTRATIPRACMPCCRVEITPSCQWCCHWDRWGLFTADELPMKACFIVPFQAITLLLDLVGHGIGHSSCEAHTFLKNRVFGWGRRAAQAREEKLRKCQGYSYRGRHLLRGTIVIRTLHVLNHLLIVCTTYVLRCFHGACMDLMTMFSLTIVVLF